MEHIWAPWRMEFILRKDRDGCIFCDLPAERSRLREHLVLHIGARAFVILNRYPYTCGHLMVVPTRHTDDFLSLSDEENTEMARLLQVSMGALKEAYRPEGFNLGTNLGHCAGAGIRDHLHHHLIPRWIGDSNFFPIVGMTRSLPEMLSETYDRLRPHFRRLEESAEIAPGGHEEAEKESDAGARNGAPSSPESERSANSSQGGGQ